MAAAVGLAAPADGWAVDSSGESDDGLEAQAAARAVTAIVPVQNFLLNPASL